MNWKQYSEIQRQIGYIEGLSMAVNEGVGADLTEAVSVLADMINELPIDELKLEIGDRYGQQQETGTGF